MTKNIFLKIIDLKNIPRQITEIHKKQEEIKNRIEDLYYDTMVAVKAPFIQKDLIRFKNINKDKSVACIACGPSVNYFENYDKNLILCGVNASIRKFDNLNYLFRHDYSYNDKKFNKEMDEYKGNNCIKFYGIHSQRRLMINKKNGMTIDRIPQHSFLKENVYPFLLMDSFHSNWALNLECEPFGDIGGTVFSALQFLLYTNPKKLYLVGHDCSSGYFYENKSKNSFEYRIEWYKEFKDFANFNYPETEIISINPVGLKGIFNDIYTKNYLNSNLD